jgi:hypothetical protein
VKVNSYDRVCTINSYHAGKEGLRTIKIWIKRTQNHHDMVRGLRTITIWMKRKKTGYRIVLTHMFRPNYSTPSISNTLATH